jgi:hypothetical protein
MILMRSPTRPTIGFYVRLSARYFNPAVRMVKSRAWLFSVALLSAVCVLSSLRVRAEELPVRKPGLWETKVVRIGGPPLLATVFHHCTNATVDHEMIGMHFSPAKSPACSQRDVKKTENGVSTEIVCDYGAISNIFRADFAGDFQSFYSVKSRSWMEGSRQPREIITTVEAKWLGACGPDERPGDIVLMPRGSKLNVFDANEMKARVRSLEEMRRMNEKR